MWIPVLDRLEDSQDYHDPRLQIAVCAVLHYWRNDCGFGDFTGVVAEKSEIKAALKVILKYAVVE